MKNALDTMKMNGIALSIVMPPPQPKVFEMYERFFHTYLFIRRKFPDRFAIMAGGASLNPRIIRTPPGEVSAELRRKFDETAEDLLRQGAVGFGEMTALHFSLFHDHAYEEARPDHPLFFQLADIAGRHGVPIDLHMEAVSSKFVVPRQLRGRSSADPGVVDENISTFERLLAHNRKAKIVWVHAGWDNTGHYTPALIGRLLRKHPNLYLSLKKRGQLFAHNSLLSGDGTIDSAWRKVIIEFPDRFMVGSDGFYAPPGADDHMPPPEFSQVLGISLIYLIKKWFFKGDGVLCRTFGRANKNHCTRVQQGEGPNGLIFFNDKLRYHGRLYPGRRSAPR